MKILMIAPTPFFSHRGTHIRIYEEARALEKLGHEIVIVTYHNGDDIHKYIETKIDVRRIRRWLFWYKKTEAGPDWQKVLLNIFLIRKTFYMIRTWKPDVVHGHLHEGALIGKMMRIIFFWRKFLLVSDFHGSLVNEMKSHGYLKISWLKSIFNFLERKINSIGDVAVVSDKNNVKIIKNARGDEKAFHVSDGVNVDYYKDLDDKKNLRKKFNIPVDKFVVVYTGALIENKGVKHLINSIKKTVKNLPDVYFVIGGFPAGWVRNYIAKNNLEKSVTVISPLNYFSLAEVNSLADVAVDPKDNSVQQASGKILHYMVAKTAIICCDRAINRNYLGDDGGVYLSEVNAENICQSVKKLYNDRELVKNYAENAFRRAEKFSWKKIGEQLEGIYKSNK
ncbi:MAG: glycosyltransferase [Methylococcales bacterium]|nr:glycosyltransferase [Candidatus Moranbacteria bacterium]MCK4841291.1 glycosyltransferase [Methylococcales bacterium]